MISTNFTYDGISGSSMGIYLIRTSSGLFDFPYVPSRNISEDYPKNAISPYFYNAQIQPQTLKLTFSALEETIDENLFKEIAKWMFQSKFKSFISEDSADKIYYLMAVNEIKPKINANKQGYFEVDFRSKFPYALTRSATPTFDLTDNETTTTIEIDNKCDVFEYFYPEFSFEISEASTPTFSLTNLSDNNRTTSFSDLLNGEIITIDNQKQIIVSSNNIYRFNNFNKNWFRLVQGTNKIQVQGKGILSFYMQFPVFM